VTTPTPQHLGEGVVYEARMPLTCKVLKALPDERQQQLLNDHNDSVLRTVLSLEEISADHAGEGAGTGQEYARLDAKLNLLLDLVGQMLAAQSKIPAKATLRLGAETVEWLGDGLPKPDQFVLLELYLHPSYPRPLRLLGKVLSGTGRLGESAVVMRYDGTSESVQEALEKLIFRHHRRAVAQARAKRN